MKLIIFNSWLIYRFGETWIFFYDFSAIREIVFALYVSSFWFSCALDWKVLIWMILGTENREHTFPIRETLWFSPIFLVSLSLLILSNFFNLFYSRLLSLSLFHFRSIFFIFLKTVTILTTLFFPPPRFINNFSYTDLRFFKCLQKKSKSSRCDLDIKKNCNVD